MYAAHGITAQKKETASWKSPSLLSSIVTDVLHSRWTTACRTVRWPGFWTCPRSRCWHSPCTPLKAGLLSRSARCTTWTISNWIRLRAKSWPSTSSSILSWKATRKISLQVCRLRCSWRRTAVLSKPLKIFARLIHRKDWDYSRLEKKS